MPELLLNAPIRRPLRMATELTLPALMHLIDPETYLSRDKVAKEGDDWVPYRDAAMAALCWLVGIRPNQLWFVDREQWRPDRQDIVQLRAGGHLARYRARDLPVMEGARDAVQAYLEACPHRPGGNGPLFVSRSGARLNPNDLIKFNERLSHRTHAFRSLADLHQRFVMYVENCGATDGSVEWLLGRAGRYARLTPSMKAMRKLLETVHPASLTNLPA